MAVTKQVMHGHVLGMGVVIHPGRLRLELARRGWSASDLAREAGISPPTISAALAGRPIAARSLGLIADCLSRVAPSSVVDALILGERDRNGEESSGTGLS